ncbi:MAG: outer membrane beta-barrel protein [Panacibacter sp.]
MSKVILLSLLLMGFMPVFSQITTLSDAELGFGLEAVVPMKGLKETQKTGIGGSIKFAYTIPNTYYLSPSFQAGFLAFTGKPLPDSATNLLKETYHQVTLIPVKFGLRYTFAGGLYAEPQAGVSLELSEDDLGQANNAFGFTYAMNIGFQTLPGMDISARYESINFVNSTVSMAGIRIAYHFTFRRQEIY